MGNTRVTFTTKPKTWTFKGTFETENASEEESTYSNIAETRATFNSADAHLSGIDNATDNEEVQVNNAQSMGAGLSLPVAVGDTLSMEVYGYYEGGSGYDSDIGLATFIEAVAGGFGGVSGGTESQQATYDAFNSAINGIGFTGTSDDLVPAAYLNYILFDENMQYYQHGHAQIGMDANFGHQKISIDDIVATKAGFVFIYLSNESDSPNPVYFDDMKVTLSESCIIEKQDYYPFGMMHSGNYQRVTAKKNDFKYNGFELQTELEWGVYDYQNRYYDPELGRFLNVDPAADLMRRHSPYNYAYDNPIRFIDPDGMVPNEVGKEGCPDGDCPDPKPVKDDRDGQVTYVMDDVEIVAERLPNGNPWEGFKEGWSFMIDSDDSQSEKTQIPLEGEGNTNTSESELEEGIEVVGDDGDNNAPEGDGEVIYEVNDHTDGVGGARGFFTPTYDYSDVNGTSFYIDAATGDTLRQDVKGYRDSVSLETKPATRKEKDSLNTKNKKLFRRY